MEDTIDSLVLASARPMKSVLALLFALWTSVAAAQINTGEISGIVRDSVGGVLPGAAIIATHTATGTRPFLSSRAAYWDVDHRSASDWPGPAAAHGRR